MKCKKKSEQKMTKYQKLNYALAIAFARGIIDGEQLDLLMKIYRGEK
jgi:hypothetical protein